MKYFSMFSGVGGFELGLERANSISRIEERKIQTEDERIMSNTCEQNGDGREQHPLYKCIGYSEIDKFSIQTYEKHFKHKNFGDATKIKASELPDFDLLCGGFPCQAFSIAGNRKGLEDTRGTMFFEIARIIKSKRPKYLFLENVKGLLSHETGETKTFKIIGDSLEELGYDVQWMVFNSKFFGVPQNRERIFIIGNLRGESRPEILPLREISESIAEDRKSQNVGTICAQYAKNPTDGNYIKCHQRTKDQYSRIYDTEGVSPTLAGASKLSGDCTPKIQAVLTPNRKDKRQNGRRFKEEGEPSFTLTGQDIHGVSIMRGRPKMPYENGKRELEYKSYKDYCPTLSENCASGDQKNIVMPMIRRLTPIECERLQGFPDNWTEGVSDTQRYKQMGNAVTVNVIKAIAEKLLK